MSGVAGPGRPAADPRRCVGCARPFASPVPFCPFCGVAQRPEVPVRPAQDPLPVRPAQESTPMRPAQESTPVRPAPKPIPLVPNVTAPPPVPADVAPEPVPEPVWSRPPARVQDRTRRPWLAWLVGGGLIVVGVGSLLFNASESATAGLIVHVHAPDGTSVPAGEVLVNNQSVGAPGATLAVPPGTMTVSYAKPGWDVHPRTVSIAAHASVTVDFAARELPGHLTLTTTPSGATITAAGRSLGKTPLGVDLAPGHYDISVSLNGYVGKVVALTVARGEPATINVDLAQAPPRRAEAPFDRGVTIAVTPLSAAPAPGADTLAVLDPGTEVQVLAKVLSDPPWLQVRAGTRTGYVPTAGSVEPWQSWAQRNTVTGLLAMITTDLRVIIGGNAYPLAGVQAPPTGGADLDSMDAALLDQLRGSQLRCVPRDPASFVCTTPEGRDVAQIYLLNGGAVLADGAPPSYAEAQRSAREQRRGVWAQ